MEPSREDQAAPGSLDTVTELTAGLGVGGGGCGFRTTGGEHLPNTEAMALGSSDLTGGDAPTAWHVLQTAPHRELHVSRQLAAYGLESYVPEFPRSGRTKPGSVRDRRHSWVFPGYVFIRPPRDVKGWELIRWAPGVRRVLEHDGAPGVISDLVVRHLQRRIAEMDLQPRGSRFEPGERVVIERGPLAAVDAIFDRQLDSPARVQILVQMMGRPLPVTIDPRDLRSLAS